MTYSHAGRPASGAAVGFGVALVFAVGAFGVYPLARVAPSGPAPAPAAPLGWGPAESNEGDPQPTAPASGGTAEAGPAAHRGVDGFDFFPAQTTGAGEAPGR